MIRRIVLENYMSHSHTVIEPAAGLTVLVGPNNCGKSAVLSAIQSVCGETTGDYMVRHGQKLARVTIETDDGHTIIWQRKGGAISYTIDGTEVHRVGRGRNALPDNLDPLLRMPLIEAPSGKTFQVHLGSQKDPIFLLDSESDLAAFFSSSAESERLMEMQRRHKAKVLNRRANFRSVEADLALLGAKLSKLENLEDLTPGIEKAEADYRSALATELNLSKLSDHIARLGRLGLQIDQLSSELSATADLNSPPTLEDTRPLESTIADFSRWESQVAGLQGQESALAPLQVPPSKIDPAPLATTVTSLERATTDVVRWGSLTGAMDSLSNPPVLEETQPLEVLGRAIRKANVEQQGAQAVVAALEPLQDVPNLADLTSFGAALLQFERTAAKLQAATVELATAESSLSQVEAEIVRFVTQYPLCPTCGGPLTASHVMHGGLDHVET